MIRQGRYYEVDGMQYPSVTTALGILNKPELNDWRARVGIETADQVMAEAADLGSEVHKICEKLNKGEKARVDSEILPMIHAYQEWFAKAVDAVIDSERVVVSRKYQYAGTADLLVILKGDKLPSVIDIKTSKVIYPVYGLQLAAYKAALEEEGIRVGRRLILHLDKINRGKFKTKEFRDNDNEHRQFLYALSLYRHFNPMPKRAITEGVVPNDECVGVG